MAWCLKLLFVSLMTMKTSAALQNVCPVQTELKTRTACHSCSVTALMLCPPGFRQTPRSTGPCKYHIKTASLTLAISGCFFECVKSVEMKRCCPGFWGPDCIECPEHAAAPCSNRGICSDGLGGNGTCSCQPGFAGTACELCASGRYGPTCEKECSCLHGLCNSGQQGDGTCTCFSGYGGSSCDQELPGCASLSCGPNSRCMEEALTEQLVCHCLPGYQRSADQCVSIDPCLQRLCSLHASCVHTGPNQHMCVCQEGYRGDGTVCVAVDPCQSRGGGCLGPGASCVYDGPGKSHCECLSGFVSASAGCRLKDSCRPDSCHKNANCSTVEPGRVECTCLPGYLGNGQVCYGDIMSRLNEMNTEPGGTWTGQLSSAIQLFDTVSWPLQSLGPFTVFVPINKGFRGNTVRSLTSDLSKARYLCKMHLVAGVMTFDSLKNTDVFYVLTGKSAETETSEMDSQTRIRLHGSRRKSLIVQSDVVASNGMIHLVNKLMDSVTATVESNTQENLMKILGDNGKFDQFRNLLQKADLASILDGPGPVTVFAPSGSAFDWMKEGEIQHLTSAEGRNKLVELLRNHIVPATSLEVFNAVTTTRLTTAANQVLTFNVTRNGQLLVNGAAVLEAAVEARNGRLYVVDGVLTPASVRPILPHRCDVTQDRTRKGECMSCSKIQLSPCSAGVFTGRSTYGCLYLLSVTPSLRIPVTGCLPLCNVTATTAACCKGFYGPDCRPCPGGFQNPCSGHGQCMEGIGGNGSCVCDLNFGGSRCQFCSSPSKYGPSCDRTCACVHGVCDSRAEADGGCKAASCQSGFTGRLCDRQTAPCGGSGRYCHAHADCYEEGGAISCVCKPGYQGDGITCVEADTCAPPLRGGCSVNAKCLPLAAGKHTCQCLSGWTDDGDDCRPINNCDADRGGCHDNATCIYVGPGQSDCSCKSGFKGNGRDCEAVNQCVTADGGCHYLASCRLISSRWTCVCEDGYRGDGRVCYGTIEQELMVLPDVSEFFTWTSGSGVSLSEQNLTVLVPGSAAVGRMSEDDRTFWSRKENLPALVRNHVIPGVFPLAILSNIASVTSLLKTTLPVSTANEVTSVGGAKITTSNIAATNGLMHEIDQVLVPDRKLSDGLLATLALRPEFSLFRKSLIDSNLTAEVEGGAFTVFAPTDDAIREYLQNTGATGLDVNLTRYHVVTGRLLATELQSAGFYQTLLGFSYRLRVFPRDGKLFVNEAQINSSNFLVGDGVIHGLSAVMTINKNRCDEVTHRSVMGVCVDCVAPQTKICPNDTVPNTSVKRRRCMFSRMFEGERLLTIGCRATCLRTSIELSCCPGFFGDHCEPCPGAAGKAAGLPLASALARTGACFANGICSDGTNGTGVCVCSKGFTGTACETCEEGKYGVHCDQDCVCANGRCGDGLTGDGTCECDVGWRGIHCDQKIESSDELCGAVTCHSSANCVFGPSGSLCLCAAGFHGNGTFCQAIDPCLVLHGGCSPHAVCKRTRPGNRDCVCGNGYYGDGRVCVEINPCLGGNGGCHGNAECIHVGPNKTVCICSDGFYGDGTNCTMINLCSKRNGGCSVSARCNMTSPGVRSCSCLGTSIGDGLTCKESVGRELMKRGLKEFYFGLMMVEVSVNGRGPFTVFAPNADAMKGKVKQNKLDQNRDYFASVMRSHVVMCHTLLPDDLRRHRNLTALSGLVLTTGSVQDDITVGGANVTFSDVVSNNGIFHEIDRILTPPPSPTGSANTLKEVADHHGYKTFYSLLQVAGVMDILNDVMLQPMTLFLPTDVAMAALPRQQHDFLFNEEQRPQLVEYLKFHIIQGQKLYAESLIHMESPRTLQGSPLSFICGGSDDIGEIFVTYSNCRIVQRHLTFDGGIAFGIDCLLAPPSLGGRCDDQTSFDMQMNCGVCKSPSGRCPRGSKLKEVVPCDLPSMFVSRDTGCRSVCSVRFWTPKCCRGYYGRDCLVCPGGASAPCGNRGDCDDGHLGNGTCTCHSGFGGVACQGCNHGYYGPDCKACNCSGHGSCHDGHHGTGECFCDDGWSGERCETHTASACSPPCAQKAVCKNNTCLCRPFYQGDGYTCTVVDMCSVWNGGCAKGASCSQSEEKVTCSCPKGFQGDGFSCQPVDACVAGDNGGCHEHAICTMTSPGKKKCSCKDGYLGDGISCEIKELPISRCLQDNGRCHRDAKCTDLHFEDSLFGVFHLRSDRGQYKLTYAEAMTSCAAEGGTLASYAQLSYAQQGGMNQCAAGWLSGARVAYPTTAPRPACGFGHVGIVDYGTRKNLSETWDAFCYRVKDVACECNAGYLGDGFSCTGNLLQVLKATPTFSNFLSQILNYSQTSESGKRFIDRLVNVTVQNTLFITDNTGLTENMTLTDRDLEFHLSSGRAFPLSALLNGTRVRTRVGSLTVRGVADLMDPNALSSRYINDRFVTATDIVASNGIIHVLRAPLEAPPPRRQMAVSHQASMGVGLVLLVAVVMGVVVVGYHFYKHNNKPFQFHYFKEEEEAASSVCNPGYEAAAETHGDNEEEAAVSCRSISNPGYEPAAETQDDIDTEDKPETNGGTYDLLQTDC